MRNFLKWAVILMTAAMTAGLAASCEEKDSEEPVTLHKTWLASESGIVEGFDFGSIVPGKFSVVVFASDQKTADELSGQYKMNISVNDMIYAVFDSYEVTETDETSGTVLIGNDVTISYKDLTRDSVIIIINEKDEIEFHSIKGWGYTVNKYIDITQYLQ